MAFMFNPCNPCCGCTIPNTKRLRLFGLIVTCVDKVNHPLGDVLLDYNTDPELYSIVPPLPDYSYLEQPFFETPTAYKPCSTCGYCWWYFGGNIMSGSGALIIILTETSRGIWRCEIAVGIYCGEFGSSSIALYEGTGGYGGPINLNLVASTDAQGCENCPADPHTAVWSPTISFEVTA